MTQDWKRAIVLYHDAASVRREAERAAVVSTPKVKVHDRKTFLAESAEIDKATSSLFHFVMGGNGEGNMAMELLGVSQRVIVFGERYVGDGLVGVCYLGRNGLEQSIEMKNPKKNTRKPIVSLLSARQAVLSAVDFSGMKASEILNWLRGELDKIASEASSIPTPT